MNVSDFNELIIYRDNLLNFIYAECGLKTHSKHDINKLLKEHKRVSNQIKMKKESSLNILVDSRLNPKNINKVFLGLLEKEVSEKIYSIRENRNTNIKYKYACCIFFQISTVDLEISKRLVSKYIDKRLQTVYTRLREFDSFYNNDKIFKKYYKEILQIINESKKNELLKTKKNNENKKPTPTSLMVSY